MDHNMSNNHPGQPIVGGGGPSSSRLSLTAHTLPRQDESADRSVDSQEPTVEAVSSRLSLTASLTAHTDPRQDESADRRVNSQANLTASAPPQILNQFGRAEGIVDGNNAEQSLNVSAIPMDMSLVPEDPMGTPLTSKRTREDESLTHPISKAPDLSSLGSRRVPESQQLPQTTVPQFNLMYGEPISSLNLPIAAPTTQRISTATSSSTYPLTPITRLESIREGAREDMSLGGYFDTNATPIVGNDESGIIMGAPFGSGSPDENSTIPLITSQEDREGKATPDSPITLTDMSDQAQTREQDGMEGQATEASVNRNMGIGRMLQENSELEQRLQQQHAQPIEAG